MVIEVKKAKLKQKQIPQEMKQQPEQLMSGKQAAIMIVVMLVTFLVFYGLTSFLVSKNKQSVNSNTSSNTNSNVNAHEIAFSNLLNQSGDKYYVIAVVPSDATTIYTNYLEQIDSRNYYEINMKDKINQSYMGEKLVVSEKVKDIRISDTTLFVLEKGKIKEHYEGKENILKYLQENLPKSE